MGGGTVGFPVLVLLFDLPGSLGRNFGLAVQSIGMVSASIYILSARRPLDWHLLRPALAGALIGTPVGAAFVAPFVPDLWVKLAFAVVWCSFGILHLVKINELIAAHGENTRWRQLDRPIGLAIGITGGIVASITGVGIDMIVYAILVLLYRADLKTAIPTSVILMAVTSLIGISSNVALSRVNPALYYVDPEVFANFAKHYQTGEPMPAELVEKIKKSSTFNQGYATVEYLAAALQDIAWHQITPNTQIDDAMAFQQKALEGFGIAMDEVPPRYNSTYFNHIFSDPTGYSAGYYAYLWTEVLAQDAFEWFKENAGDKGVMNRENGQIFADKILSRGGTKDVHTLYVEFRGKEPSVEPLLEKRGLNETN